MTDRSFQQRVEAVFVAVQECAAADREAYLDQLAGAEPEVVAEVRTLLAVPDERLDDVMPSVHVGSALPEEQAGDQVGRYRLLEKIGEGGFGSVWMAEQREPVKRRVALKMIKLGMDTRQVIARFEAERQALAMMDHLHIAKVFDAGSTDTGRPYFVMEYIRGVPIVDYCDAEQLGTAARLDLFSKVCHAIQHAHQKGVIHRDIKPSNVLVTMHDGVPVPKVIDFGIAKATSAELTQRTLFTEHRQMVGTPAYMSPEQAEMSGLDVDTRSDVYALGVLLYELLTGTTPFDTATLAQAGFAEMMRVIREEQPAKPSTRLSTLGATGTRTAEQRRTDLRQLRSTLRGDLDWIVMKCLEKDRTRRYETASGLAADIRRHLDDEPVLAGPPSAGYRLRKFVRRNRVQVGAGVAVLVTLIAGIFGTAWFAIDAHRQSVAARQQEQAAVENAERARVAEKDAQDLARREADLRVAAERAGKRAEATTTFLLNTIGLANPDVTQLPDVTMRGVLDVAAGAVGASFRSYPETEAELRIVIGRAYLVLGVADAARDHLERAHTLYSELLRRDPRALFRVTRLLGMAHDRLGDIAWIDGYRDAMRLGVEAVTALQPEVGEALSAYRAEAKRSPAAVDRVRETFDQVVDVARHALAPQDDLWFEVSTSLWHHAAELGWSRSDLAIADLMDEALALYRPITQGRITLEVRQMATRALWHRLRAGDPAGAERAVRATLERLTAQLRADHPELAIYRSILGQCLVLRGELEQAELLLRGAIAAMPVTPGTLPQEVVNARDRLALLFEAAGRDAEARAERDRIAELLNPFASPVKWHGVTPIFSPGKGSVRELGDQVEHALGQAARGQPESLERVLPRFLARGREELAPGSPVRTGFACYLVALGTNLLRLGNWQRARDVLGEASSIVLNDAYDHPDLEYSAAFYFGRALLATEEWEAAEESLRQALRLAARATRAHPLVKATHVRLWLGRLLLVRGRPEAASLIETAYLEQFALRDPSTAPVAELRGDWLGLLRSKGQLDRAPRVLRQRLAAVRAESGGESPESLRLVCELAGLLGAEQMAAVADLVAPALPDAVQVPGLFPGVGNDLAWFVVRVSNRSASEYAAALQLIERVLERDPGNAAFLNSSGVALYRVGRDAEAVEALLASDERNRATAGRQPADWAFLALAHLRLGHTEDALAAYAVLDELMRDEAHANRAENRALHAEAMARRPR